MVGSHGRGSVVLPSLGGRSDWHQVAADSVAASATIDRPCHTAAVVNRASRWPPRREAQSPTCCGHARPKPGRQDRLQAEVVRHTGKDLGHAAGMPKDDGPERNFTASSQRH